MITINILGNVKILYFLLIIKIDIIKIIVHLLNNIASALKAKKWKKLLLLFLKYAIPYNNFSSGKLIDVNI